MYSYIVNKDYVEQFISNVGRLYEDKTGLKADFYVVEVGEGQVEYDGI